MHNFYLRENDVRRINLRVDIPKCNIRHSTYLFTFLCRNVSKTYSWWIKPLHSSITAEEQDEVLKSPPQSDQRKIILSTNIAESSLTVPDVKYGSCSFHPLFIYLHLAESAIRKRNSTTNFCYTSTLPLSFDDCSLVIDFCLTKMLVTDESTNFTSLELEWASKNSLMQRAGRVGRVGEGRVYRMIHKEFYKVRNTSCAKIITFLSTSLPMCG